MQIPDEPEQDAGREEIEDHAGLQRHVMAVHPSQCLGRGGVNRGCWG